MMINRMMQKQNSKMIPGSVTPSRQILQSKNPLASSVDVFVSGSFLGDVADVGEGTFVCSGSFVFVVA
jgi:hypothetical protein